MTLSGIAALASLKADTLDRAYGLLVLAGLGIGGIVVPASIMTTIVCPDVSLSQPKQSSPPSQHLLLNHFSVHLRKSWLTTV